MSANKWLVTPAVLTAVLLGVFADGRVTAQERNKNPDGKEGTVAKGTLAAVDAEKNSVTVTTHTFNRATQEGKDVNTTYPLTKNAKVLQDGVAAKLADLKKGYPVVVQLDGTNAASVSVDGGTAQGEFRSANPDRNTITVLAGRNMQKQVYHLIKTTTVTDGEGKAVAVKDLKSGMKLALTRSVEDDNTAVAIRVLPASDK